MRQVFTQTGTSLTLGRTLGAGGEGTVYETSNGLVAKIYHKAPSAEHVTKLRLMASRSRPALLTIAAWPTEVIASRNGGAPIGFLMPIVTRRYPIFRLYTPATRKHAFPNADFRFLLFAARNVAIAMAEIQAAGALVGDLNERNVLVGEDARVIIVDCDSFQISADGRVYRCPVGLAHYTAPELQGFEFDRIDRTPESDAFALAVLLFQVLCLARYPFVTALANGTEVPIEEAIRTFRFAWAPDAVARGVSAPPRSMPLRAIGDLGNLFVDAFSPHRRRPSPTQWIDAITALERTLVPCPRSEGHSHARAAGSCPWCELIGQGVSDPFITITIRTATLASWPLGADPEAMIRLVEGLPRPEPVETTLARRGGAVVPRAFQVPPSPGPPPATVPAWMWIVVGVPGFFFPPLFLGLIPLAIITVILAARAGEHQSQVRSRDGAIERERESRRATLLSARQATDRAVAETRGHDNALEQKRRALVTQLREGKSRVERLAQSLPDRLRRMESQLVEMQREDYLEQFDVEDAVIDRFPRPLKKTLKSYGVYSAADLTSAKLQNIPGVGAVRRRQLLHWRAARERGFVPDPNRRLTDQERQRAVLEIAQERDEELKKLQKIANAFQMEFSAEMARSTNLRAGVVQARHAVIQAEVDVNALPGP